MAVDESKYRRLRDSGFSHAAALDLADETVDELGFGGGGGTVSLAWFETVHGASTTELLLGRGWQPVELKVMDEPPRIPANPSLATVNETGGVVLQQTGFYHVSFVVTASVTMDSEVTASIITDLLVNGSVEPWFITWSADGRVPGTLSASGSIIHPFEAGDVLQPEVVFYRRPGQTPWSETATVHLRGNGGRTGMSVTKIGDWTPPAE